MVASRESTNRSLSGLPLALRESTNQSLSQQSVGDDELQKLKQESKHPDVGSQRFAARKVFGTRHIVYTLCTSVT